MILTDAALRADWQAELEEVRLGMLALREQLAAELRRAFGVGPVRLSGAAPRHVFAAGRDPGTG